MSKRKQPDFFKVFLGEDLSNPLKIPTAFVGHMGRKASGSVKLRGPGGACWQVELAWKDGELCFGEGWGEFVADNQITVGDFLIFSSDRNSLFEVKILDPSACEKEAAFSAKCSQAVRESKSIKQEKKENFRARTTTTSSPVSDSSKRAERKTSEKKLQETSKGRSTPRRSPKAADSFTSVCPSFVTCMKRYNVLGAGAGGSSGIMFTIPAEFMKEHNLSYKKGEEIVLRNNKGKSWTVGIITRVSDKKTIYSHVLTRGWGAFVRENNIKIGDTCMFELKKRLLMRVHIIHKRS